MKSKIHRNKMRRCNCLIETGSRCRSAALGLAAFLQLLAWQKVCAQFAPADDFFNGGAQFYISNNIPAALERVESGLKVYPDDVKLKKLEELLKQQQQQQQNQQQDQQNQQNQQNQSQQQEQKNQQDQQQQNQQQQNQSAQQKQQQGKTGQQENEKQPAAAMQGKEMTPEEAKRLLDAQKGQEQLLQWKPQEKQRNPLHPIKDW
jgi:Ca-activated chloride channel family protein